MHVILEVPVNCKPSWGLMPGGRYKAIVIDTGSIKYGRSFAVNYGNDSYPGYTHEYNALQLNGASWVVHEMEEEDE